MFNLVKLWMKYNKYLPTITAIIDAVKAILDAVKKNDPLAIDAGGVAFRTAVYNFMPDNWKVIATPAEADSFITGLDDTVKAVIKTVKAGIALFKV